MTGRVRPAGGRGTKVKRTPGEVKKHHPKGTVCEAKGCTTFLSVYNDDTICAPCYEAIDIMDLPTTLGKFIKR